MRKKGEKKGEGKERGTCASDFFLSFVMIVGIWRAAKGPTADKVDKHSPEKLC